MPNLSAATGTRVAGDVSRDCNRLWALIDSIVENGGPTRADYAGLDRWVAEVCETFHAGRLTSNDLHALRSRFGEAFSRKTLQGHALEKPYGYAGDFEIIDRIYRESVASEPHLKSWDIYWQSHAAPRAVRNRKQYFHQLLNRHCARKRPLRVLNLASGPGRCMHEWLRSNPNAQIRFECIDIDGDAIRHARQLNHKSLDCVSFAQKNALRFGRWAYMM